MASHRPAAHNQHGPNDAHTTGTKHRTSAAARGVQHAKVPVTKAPVPHPASKAATTDANAAARAAMQQAVHPLAAAPKAAPKAASTAGSSQVTPSTSASEGQGSSAIKTSGGGKSLQRQWADELGMPSAAAAEAAAGAGTGGQAKKQMASRTGLVSMPKGMSSVKRDGNRVGSSIGSSMSARENTFHLHAASAVLEAYLGKHAGSESSALTLIAVGALMILTALVGLLVSELSVVALVRNENLAERTKVRGGGVIMIVMIIVMIMVMVMVMVMIMVMVISLLIYHNVW